MRLRVVVVLDLGQQLGFVQLVGPVNAELAGVLRSSSIFSAASFVSLTSGVSGVELPPRFFFAEDASL